MNKVRSLLVTLLSGVVVAIPTPVAGQERGTVSGTVVDEETQSPLVGVQVTIVGTNIDAVTNQDGRYIISNAPVGSRQVRAVRLGYGVASQTVTVSADAPVTADFALAQSAIALEGLMVSVTGQTQRRREVGNSVANIDMTDIELAPIQTFSQLLQGRAAGVSVLESAGTSGTGARVRVRGSNSISLSNEPLVIVDGMRVNNSPASLAMGIGGQSISRLNDINAEDIESVEILKGPAASALYGTAAANGVIQITTRRGRAGTTRWNVYGEIGSITENSEFPANYSQRGRLLVGPDEGAEFDGCDITLQADDICEPLELNSFNPLMQNSPFRDGNLYTVGLNVAGGSDQVQYYLSGETGDENGIYEINFVDRVNLRGNLTARPHDNVDLSLNTGYLSSRTRLPLNDNAVEGFLGAGYLGDAFDGETGGYFAYANDRRLALERFQNVQRLFGSVNASWRPQDWLAISGNAGMDILSRDDESGVPPGIFTPGEDPDNAIGNRSIFNGLVRNYTARLSGIGTFQVTPDLSSITTVGGSYLEDRFQRSDAGGFNLLPGTSSLGALSERFFVDESDQRTITVSGFVSQQFGWRDRLFVTAGLRGDRNSNFGADLGFELYPSMSTSWVIGEEPWFPRSDVFSSLRLRAAYGQSGLMPDFRTAEQFYTPVTATIRDASEPAITIGGAGNPDLKPERSREYEAGLDAGFFSERIGFQLTYYDKRSTDALVDRLLAPSLGSSEDQTVNLGSVANTGWEAQLDARIVDLPQTQWSATISLATNRNRLLELGEGIEPIVFGIGGDSQHHEEGYPLGAYWGTELLGWDDTDGDGIIAAGEIELSEPKFLGTPFPKREITLSSSVTLFNSVRIFALLDHKGGHHLFNSTEEFRCGAFFNCRGIQDRTAPLAEQAAAVATAIEGSIGPFVEPGDYTKLREVSVAFLGLERFAQRAGFGGLARVSLTLSGRNLVTWTDYSGLDPEINSGGQSNFSTFDFLGQPPVRTLTARLDIGF
ncbi:MAG: SusC/RagA family TonB-linked outer membrane protein [Longimicrobiales bacterium]